MPSPVRGVRSVLACPARPTGPERTHHSLAESEQLDGSPCSCRRPPTRAVTRLVGPAEHTAKRLALTRSSPSRKLPRSPQWRRLMSRPFLDALTPLVVLTLVATV